MNPDLVAVTSSFQTLIDSINTVRHANFYRREAEYWRTEAKRLRAILDEIEEHVQMVAHADEEPEPPVGTEFVDADGDRLWFHGDTGWHCAREGCSNCPTQWVEVIDRLPGDADRKLPGGAA